jgi:hypothetical protein
MNANLVLNLLDLAVTLTKSHLEGSDIEESIVEVIHAAGKIYEDHTGQPINISLIQPEASD